MIVRCRSLCGEYRLPANAIRTWWESDDPNFIFVKMSLGQFPLLIRGTMASMEKAVADAIGIVAPPIVKPAKQKPGRVRIQDDELPF